MPGLPLYRDTVRVAPGEATRATNRAAGNATTLEGQPDRRSRNEDEDLPAPPHDAACRTGRHRDELFVVKTEHCGEAVVGGGYRSRLIGFGDVLTDDEILAVLVHIKSTRPDRGVEAHGAINAAE